MWPEKVMDGEDKEIDPRFNVLMIGDSYVGKNELLNSLSHSEEATHGTGGVSYIMRTVSIYGKQVELYIWSIDNLDSVFPLREIYTRGASGAILVYDVTCRRSFERLHRRLSIFDNETPTILLGNKCDKTDREVTKEEGEKLASEKGIRFLESSAINNVNVDEAFTTLARDMLLRQDLENFAKLVPPTVDLLHDPPQIEPNFSLENLTLSNILRFSVEQNYHIRVMLVGNEGVGKSTLLKRLLKRPVKINKYDSTNGIDVHIDSCDVDIETGTWCINGIYETVIAKLLKYIGAASTTSQTGKAALENRSIHMRVAKMLTNIYLPTPETMINARGSVPVQMEKNSMSEMEDNSNEQKTICEFGDDATGFNMSNKCVDSDSAIVTPAHPSIDYNDIETILTKVKSLVALKENPKARVDFYDFAGQLVFHASHPTFLSSKAIYIMTFDLNKFHSDRRTRKVNEGHTTGRGEVNEDSVSDIESIFFWLNIVYMFALSKQSIHPHVILVGTHADMLPKANRDRVADTCFREIRSLLADSPLKQILSEKEFAVDNMKKTDPCLAELKTEILNLAKIQPYWGEQTPSRWLPLEREIQHAKDSGLKVLSLAKVRDLNRRLEIQIPGEEELQMFLQFLHDTGEMIYFNEPTLRDSIVLDPVWLIDALKALITADRFAIRSNKHADKWKLFCETGIVHKSTIIDIFKEKKDLALFKNSEHVLRLMEKFLFIASIDNTDNLKDNGDINPNTDVVYIVPSMVQKSMNKKLITSPEGLSSTTVLCMASKNNFLPSAVFHKLLAKCISKWEIAEQSGHKQIFCDVCKFNLDKHKHYKLILVSVQHAVHAKIISYIDTSRPRPTLCELVHDFLIESLKNILTCMGFSDEFITCIQCPRHSLINHSGYIDTVLMDNQDFVTCDKCHVSHVMLTADLIDCWTGKEPALDEETKPQMKCPTKDIEGGTDEDTNNTIKETDFEQPLFGAPIKQGHLNHARVCNALVTVCADGLRDILLSKIPHGYVDFYELLRKRRSVLMAMKNLRQEQFDLIFPDPRGRYTGTVDQFDITLLYTLIRNISSVNPPVTGWGKAPVDNPRDTSLGAATERIRICRNCIIGHSMDGQLDDQSFEHYWKDICMIMDDIEQSLGTKGYQEALKKRKDQILSPAEAQSLRATFSAFQADVLSAVDIVMETMRNLKARAEHHD